MKNLVIRGDASSEIGIGHVMRCLALAQAWQDIGGRATFITAMEAPGLRTRLEAEGMRVVQLSAIAGTWEDAAQTLHHAREIGAAWVVVDGYQFSSGYQRAFQDAGLKLLFLDDDGRARHYYADLVLNQSLHGDASLYSQREPYTRLLLGTRYALLRREFLDWRQWQRVTPAISRRVLVTLGGSDPDNTTLRVIQALQEIDTSDLDVKVVIGPSNPHVKSLKGAMLSAPCSIQILQNVIAMPELMAWADVALSAGGSTCWELAFMGLPFIVMVLAGNQEGIADGLDRKGLAIRLQRPETAAITDALAALLPDQKTREGMSVKGRALVDGYGASRVTEVLRKNCL